MVPTTKPNAMSPATFGKPFTSQRGTRKRPTTGTPLQNAINAASWVDQNDLALPAEQRRRHKSSQSRSRRFEFLHVDPVREQVSDNLLLFLLIHAFAIFLKTQHHLV